MCVPIDLSSNRLVSPGDWQTWGRAADSDDSMAVFKATLTPFVQFCSGAWLVTWGDASDASGAQVLEMSKASERQSRGQGVA